MFKTLSLIITTALLSVIFTLAALGFYVWKYNPMNMKAYLIAGFMNVGSLSTDTGTEASGTEASTGSGTVDNPLLSAEQESLLESAGIDVGSLPTSISPELEACFVEKLGSERVEEIKGGDVPGPLELLKAKGCL